MGKQSLTFRDIEIEKNKFYRHKTPISLRHVDIEKVLASDKIYFGEKNYKHFIGYSYNSSIINEGIRAILNPPLFFFYKKISHAHKTIKIIKSTYKHKKHKTHKTSNKWFSSS